MVLVDTSVWVTHFRHGSVGLETRLAAAQVVCHPFIIGEVACGNLKNRAEILSLRQALPMALSAEHAEVLRLIETYRLMGQGLGYVDVHLLASARLSEVPLWTLDKSLNGAASMLGLDHRPT